MSHAVFTNQIYRALDLNAKFHSIENTSTQHSIQGVKGQQQGPRSASSVQGLCLSEWASPQAWGLAGPEAKGDTGKSVRTWGLDFGGFVLCHLKSLCHSWLN